MCVCVSLGSSLHSSFTSSISITSHPFIKSFSTIWGALNSVVVNVWITKQEVGSSNPLQGRSLELRFVLHLCSRPTQPYWVHRLYTVWRKDEMPRGRVGHPHLYAEAKKIRLRTLNTRNNLMASLKDCPSSSPSSVSHTCKPHLTFGWGDYAKISSSFAAELK